MNALEFIRKTDIGSFPALESNEAAAVTTNVIDVDKLPPGLVIGNTLLDVQNIPSQAVRAGISLSMLFASRVASSNDSVQDEDAWLASYLDTLGKLGFSLQGTASVNSTFKKLDVGVHEAIIPFLTIAFGGAAVGPVILAALENLKKVNPNSSWITLFDRESRRFSVREMHFAAAVPGAADTTEIRYAVARLNVEQSDVQVLFFKVSKNTAEFESLTTRIAVNNSLMAVVEDDLKERLSKQIKTFIWDATIKP